MADLRAKIIRRSVFFFTLFIALTLVIIVTATYIKIVYGPIYEKELKNSAKTNLTISAIRGNILATDGRTLACSVPYYTIGMDPCTSSDEVFNKGIDSLSICLANLYKDKSAQDYKNMIVRARAKNLRYITINRKRVTFPQYKEMKTFPIFKKGKNKGGFLYTEVDYRKMPFGHLARRTIGKIDGSKVGLELAYDRELSGKNGIENEIKITDRLVRQEVVAPEDGKNILTTIDVDIQDVAETSMLNQLQKHDADHGVAILMEVKTGAVRAIVNLHRQSPGEYTEDFNYAIAEALEPGSTFKLATVMACLEDGFIHPNDTINTFNGEYQIHDRLMKDSKKGGHGIVTVEEAFAVSSNIAFSRIVEKYYGHDKQRFLDRLDDLGLNDSLGIEISGEGKTFIKKAQDKWYDTDLPWMSIGYTLRITPLHLLTLYNAVANGGTMMRPMFVEGIVEHGRIVEHKRPKVLRNSIASRKTIEIVKHMLEMVVNEGTAANISGTPYGIAGKTGTAQIAGKDGYGKNKKYLASFAGYFPTDEPKYSCIVMVYGPSNNVYYGNVIAGTVVKAIADRVYAADYRKGKIEKKQNIALSKTYPYSKGGRLKDIIRVFSDLEISHNADINSKWISTTAKEDHIHISEKRIIDGIMPDVRGMGASDAVNLLESRGLKVKLSGYGHVVTQSIPQGTTYTKGSTVFIELKNG